MSEELTPCPPDSLVSKPARALGTINSSTPPPKADLAGGVRRSILRLSSVPSIRRKTSDIETSERAATATPDLAWAGRTEGYIDRAATATPDLASVGRIPGRIDQRPGHSRSYSALNYNKPLPKTPISPTLEQLLQIQFRPLETQASPPAMSRSARSGSRTSTMDSSTSGPATQMYIGGYKPVDMTGSQSSIASSSRTEEEDARDILTPKSNGPPSAAPSPAQPRPSVSSMGTPQGSSTHLSGLMCNVHRTTGREPHPLVGATTTILGDRLYVFGGRILSRSRPALTSDLYELDLIRRHWTRVEATGDIPPPRYFHSVCALGDTKLVCYGGMSPAPTSAQTPAPTGSAQEAQPEVVVMSDIYIYDAPTKVWTYIPIQEAPQGRYAHCATILPSSATFSSANAPASALQHNPPGSAPNQGTIGVNIDGTGGAELIVVGGQDSANHYIEQISVFNLRSLKWTSTSQLGKSCGAYRSTVTPVPTSVASRLGKSSPTRSENIATGQEPRDQGSCMLIYSNYNFLDVKLELQIRLPDGTLSEKPMQGTFSPPGLRFPNGGVVDTNFVVSGTYLTSSKQEYALWALDLLTLTWSRIDAGGNIFSQGSWNRGVLWNRRNTFVILGDRKRSLVEDYNHRRINFSNVCMVELEAFGLYDNPRKVSPMSGFISASSPFSGPSSKAGWAAGGRTLSRAAEELGTAALGMREIADMDILCVDGERIPVNSRIVARRWGPYFVQLLREGTATQDGTDTATLRPENIFRYNPSRNSSITITPSLNTQSSGISASSTANNSGTAPSQVSPQYVDVSSLSQAPDPNSLSPSSRPRTLYLPHTHLTLQSLLHYFYTSSLPPSTSPLCTPQILCSLLQIARPYNIDGLLEAVVERLHGVLDSRNAAAVFNASAMAAGGGRSIRGDGEWGTGTAFPDAMGASTGLSTLSLEGDSPQAMESAGRDGLRINTSVADLNTGNGVKGDEDGELSATSSVASESASESGRGDVTDSRSGEIWKGDISAVIGLQKRGLRGLMEGRRLRERGAAPSMEAKVGLGIASG